MNSTEQQELNQLISKALSSNEVIDILSSVGLAKPNIAVLPTSSWRKSKA